MEKFKIIFIFVLQTICMDNKKEITIHDIARELDISASTVSRALNNNPKISLKTRKKIQDFALKLGYRPNIIASNLRTQRTFTIGIVVPLINRHFFSSVISGVEAYASEAGYNVIIAQSNDQYDKETSIAHSLYSNRVDGVIISIAMESEDFTHLSLFTNKSIPLVFFDRAPKEIYTHKIIVDDYAGGYKATKHLIDQGYKKIAHISGPLNLQIYKDRLQGYKDALKDAGLVIDETLILHNRLIREVATNAFRKLITSPSKPDACFCGNDTTALSSIIYCKENGIKVPEDIGIVGFSNEPFSEVVTPSISTIKQPGFEMGQTACELLIEQIENKSNPIDFQTLTMPNELIVRGSSVRK